MSKFAHRHAGIISTVFGALFLFLGLHGNTYAGNEFDLAPRCASDDYNSTALPLCYVQPVDGSERIYLDANDERVAQ